MKQIITCLSFMMLFFIAEAQITREEALIRQLEQHNAATLVNNDTVAIKKYLAMDFLLNGSNNKVSFLVNEFYHQCEVAGLNMCNLTL